MNVEVIWLDICGMDLTGEQATSKLIGLCICSTDLTGKQAASNTFNTIGSTLGGSRTNQEKSLPDQNNCCTKCACGSLAKERLNCRPVKFIESAGGSAGTMLSFVSRPKRGRRKDHPGFHCLHIRLITVESQTIDLYLCACDVKIDTQITWSRHLHMYHSIIESVESICIGIVRTHNI